MAEAGLAVHRVLVYGLCPGSSLGRMLPRAQSWDGKGQAARCAVPWELAEGGVSVSVVQCCLVCSLAGTDLSAVFCAVHCSVLCSASRVCGR